MKAVKAARRLLANTDRIDEVIKGIGRLQETADNQATAVNERLDRLHRAADTQTTDLNNKLGELIEATNNQSGCVNARLDDLIERLDVLIAGTAGEPDRRAALGRRESLPIVEDEVGPGEIVDAPWLHAESPGPLPLPHWSGSGLLNGGAPRPREPNAMKHYQRLLDALEPWRGVVPQGYQVDFFGILTDAHFRTRFGADPDATGGSYTATEIPALNGDNGEWWFEAVNWLEAAREARGQFVMMTLGASYGLQAVGAHRALQIVNPMPAKLVAVEPVPENYLWTRKHFRDNGIDPDAHWLVNAAISNVNAPIFFPVGAPGSGANNCMSTDTPGERKLLVDQLVSQGRAAATLRNVMLHNRTGVMKDMLPGQDVMGEIQLVSAITLRDLLSAFDLVDYVEADIQQSEVRVFPPFLDLLKKKVRRIHIGTHGAEAHDMLHDAFAKEGWEIVFSYAPDGRYESDLGRFELCDGVLTVRNPDL